MKLSPDFMLAEFVRVPPSEVPVGVIENLERLCVTLLQPVRDAMGLTICIHSGWRAPDHNLAVGGVPTSDHGSGRAADFHVSHGGGQSWEENTFQAFHWLRKNKLSQIGQLIMEDHRIVLKNKDKLWCHVAAVSEKHPGAGDKNQLLVSKMPGSYNTWQEEMDSFA